MSKFIFYFTIVVIFNFFSQNLTTKVVGSSINNKPGHNKPGHNKPGQNKPGQNNNPSSNNNSSYNSNGRVITHKFNTNIISIRKKPRYDIDEPFPKPANDDEVNHNRCLEELKPFKICDFDFEKLYEEDGDISDICEEYYQTECQNFFKSPYKYVPSCEDTVNNNYVYSLINKYGNGNEEKLNMQWDIADRNFMCSKKNSQSTGNYCELYKEFSVFASKSFSDISDVDTLNRQICENIECRNYALEYFVSLYNTFQYNDIDNENIIVCENEIEYLSSDECKSEDELNHEQCLKELEPFEICIFDYNEVYKNGNVNSTCEEYYEKKCPEFIKSPYEYAPTCEKTVKNHKYEHLNYYGEGRFNELNYEWDIYDRKLLCAKGESGSYGEYSDLYMQVREEGLLKVSDSERERKRKN